MELTGLITAILVVTVLTLIYWLVTKNRPNNYWEKRGVPYINSLPIIGVNKDVFLMKKSIREVFDEMYKQLDGEKFGGYFQFTTPAIIMRDPELINHVLIKDFTHFEDRQPAVKYPTDLFSMNMSNLSGDEWRNVRHKLTPTFTSGKLKLMFEPIKICCDEALEYLEEIKYQDIEARGFFLKLVFNLTANVAFGLKLNTLNITDEQSIEFFKNASKFFRPSTISIFKAMIFLAFPKLRETFKVKLMDNDVETFFRKLTHDIIKYRENNGKRNDFLQLMLNLQKKEKGCLQNGVVNNIRAVSTHENEPVDSEDKEIMEQLRNTPQGSYKSGISEIFTEDFIAAQTFLFISAGSETTAGTLTFVLYELSVNQNIQKKVQDEISNVLATQEFDYQAVRKMTYLEQCIYETFRIHPQLPGLLRLCTHDYKIPGTDVIIEKGSYVNIPVSALQMDSQYFPEPEKFNPENFKDIDAVPKGVYFPFGGGPRMCIGMRLAMLQMKVVLAVLLQKYTVVLSEKTTLPLKLAKSAFTPQVEGGMWLKFQKRIDS